MTTKTPDLRITVYRQQDTRFCQARSIDGAIKHLSTLGYPIPHVKHPDYGSWHNAVDSALRDGVLCWPFNGILYVYFLSLPVFRG